VKTRKDFLLASSLTPAAALIGSTIALADNRSTLVADANDQMLSFSFDEARFRGIASRPAAHHHALAAGSIGGGAILTAIHNTFYTYTNFLRVSPEKISAVGVLYHGAAALLAVNDNAWNNLVLPALGRLPSAVHADIQTARPSRGNPVLHTGPNGVADQSLEILTAHGVAFLVCNSALVGMASMLGAALGRAATDVHRELVASLVRGSMLVPTGVWAIQALQEARYTYLQASL